MTASQKRELQFKTTKIIIGRCIFAVEQLSELFFSLKDYPPLYPDIILTDLENIEMVVKMIREQVQSKLVESSQNASYTYPSEDVVKAKVEQVKHTLSFVKDEQITEKTPEQEDEKCENDTKEDLLKFSQELGAHILTVIDGLEEEKEEILSGLSVKWWDKVHKYAKRMYRNTKRQPK